MDCIYLQTTQSKYWIEKTGHSCHVTNDLVYWTASTDRRVSVVEVLNFDSATHDLLDHCCRYGDLVFVVIYEFISDQYCQEFDLPNVVFVLNGCLNWQPEYARMIDGMYFFWSTCDFYQRFPELLESLNGPKDRVFDVLLGRRKLHRDWIYNSIDRDQNIVTYFPEYQDLDIRGYDQTQFQWPTDVLPVPNDPVDLTVQEVTVDGVIVSLSQIIPRDIYRRTCYTLVAETVCDNRWSFPTEKIAKPLLARRLFVVYAGQYYLRNLQNMGFHTFGAVIDESYDNEPDPRRRMDMVLEQVEKLQKIDYARVLEKINPIVEHNHYLMTHMDWQQCMIDSMRFILCK